MLNLSLLERRKIARALRQGHSQAEIAEMLGRSERTIQREVRRGGGQFGYDSEYSHKSAFDRIRKRVELRRRTFELKSMDKKKEQR